MVSKAGAGPQREKIALRAWLKATALAVLGARAAAAGSQGMGPENESRSGHHRLALYPQTGTLDVRLQKEPDYAVRDLASLGTDLVNGPAANFQFVALKFRRMRWPRTQKHSVRQALDLVFRTWTRALASPSC